MIKNDIFHELMFEVKPFLNQSYFLMPILSSMIKVNIRIE